MASRDRVSVVERAYAAAEEAQRAAAEAERNNQLARARREAAERARKDAEPEARRERARTEALARIAAAEDRARSEKARRVALRIAAEDRARREEARREAEDRARREAEARRAAEERKRRASDVSENPPSKKPRTNSGLSANVSSVLVGNGNGVAEEAKLNEQLSAKEPQNLGSFLFQSVSILSNGWSSFAAKLVQRQERKENSLQETLQPPATPKASPKVTVDKELIFAFKNYSNPQDYTEYDQYFRACDFLRTSPQNFEAFKKDLKEDLEKDLKNIQNTREEGQVKVKAGDILKRAEDVRGLTINEYAESKRLKDLNLQKELRIELEKQKKNVRIKAKNRSKDTKDRGWGPPPIHLPPNESKWSANEIKAMTNSAKYAQLQITNDTVFSKEGRPGEDKINWREILKGGPLVTRVYSPDSPPHHMSKLGIGFNKPLDDPETYRRDRQIENTNLGYLRSLQNQFDKEANNFDISASVDPDNSRAYIRERVAKWERESRQFKIETTTNPSNLEEYCEYLMNNIEDLKAKETEKSGEEIDKSKLKTLIAFQYLELGKIIYAGTWGNPLGALNRADDSSTQKPDIIKKILVTVPEVYQNYLKFKSGNVPLETHNSISLPRRNPLNSSKDIKMHRDCLEDLANSGRIESTRVYPTREGLVSWDEKHQKMLERGEMLEDPLGVIRKRDFGIKSTLKKVEDDISHDLSRLPDLGVIQSARMVASEVSSFFNKSSSLFDQASSQVEQRIGERANPATIRVSSDWEINTNTGLGYFNTNSDALEHDARISAYKTRTEEFQHNRDRRPEAVDKGSESRYLALHATAEEQKKRDRGGRGGRGGR